MEFRVITSARAIMIAAVLLLFAILVQGNMECEELAVEDCAFAVAASGARCVLEKHFQPNHPAGTFNFQYKCQTSGIIAGNGTSEWIETDACVGACGLTRMWVGLSTDALLEGQFMQGLCSAPCRSHCPNIMDLFTKLAAEEGVYLPNLCDTLGSMERFRKQARGVGSLSEMVASRRELRERKRPAASSTTLQTLQDVNGGSPSKPPLPQLQHSWGTHAEPPYRWGFPYTEPPYPSTAPMSPSYPYEPPNPYTHVEPPYPNTVPPLPFEPVEPPSPYGEPYPVEAPLYPIIGEPPYPQAPLLPPYFNIEPPYNQVPSESPIYIQPEPFLTAPNLPPSYFPNDDGF